MKWKIDINFKKIMQEVESKLAGFIRKMRDFVMGYVQNQANGKKMFCAGVQNE